MFNRRINIFTGHFGSGKTEVAVNFAIKLSEMYPKTAIMDFDIVNPYFRTADAKQQLEKRGIWVITPVYANTNVDVPALPPEINTLFENKGFRIVFDVGGDDLGAKALARYNEEILENDFAMFFVINTKRIMTDTPGKIEEMIYSIEQSSRLKVSGLINNTNLLQCTSQRDIIEGNEIVSSVSKRLNIPTAFTSGFFDIINPLRGKLNSEILCIEKLIKLPWE